jgi:hypothetical protein
VAPGSGIYTVGLRYFPLQWSRQATIEKLCRTRYRRTSSGRANRACISRALGGTSYSAFDRRRIATESQYWIDTVHSSEHPESMCPSLIRY